MEIVVDTSVIIAVIANEPEKASIVRQTRGMTLIAPHSVHWEIGNAFSAMLKRKRITLEQARQAIEIYKTIPIRFVDVELERALEISDEFNVYAYDAYIIQCAVQHRQPVMALDGGYNLEALAYSVKATFNVLLGDKEIDDPIGVPSRSYSPEIEPLIKKIKRVHGL